MGNSSVIARRWGSWNAALEAAGLEEAGRGRRRISNEHLLEALRVKAAALGRAPRLAEVQADPAMPGVSIFHRRFGGLRAACSAAGLEVVLTTPKGTYASRLDAYLIRTYGITEAQYNEMGERQGGVCAICGGVETGKHGRLYVDHCHESGRVRGLLCDPCNRCLADARESPSVLAAAAAYLLAAEPAPIE